MVGYTEARDTIVDRASGERRKSGRRHGITTSCGPASAPARRVKSTSCAAGRSRTPRHASSSLARSAGESAPGSAAPRPVTYQMRQCRARDVKDGTRRRDDQDERSRIAWARQAPPARPISSLVASRSRRSPARRRRDSLHLSRLTRPTAGPSLRVGRRWEESPLRALLARCAEVMALPHSKATDDRCERNRGFSSAQRQRPGTDHQRGIVRLPAGSRSGSPVSSRPSTRPRAASRDMR